MLRRAAGRTVLGALLLLRMSCVGQPVVTIAAMGDSITEGKIKGDKSQSWPAQLDATLGEEVLVMNFGKSGRTVQSTPEAYTLSSQWTKALSSGADVGVLMLGTNDAKDDVWIDRESFSSAYGPIIKKANETFTVVCLAVPTPQIEAGKSWLNPSIINNVLPQLVAALAEEFRLPLINPRPFFAVDGSWNGTGGWNVSLFRDIVHPTPFGLGLIARAVQNVVVDIVEALADAKKITTLPTTAPTANPTSLVPTTAQPTFTPSVQPTHTPATVRPTLEPTIAPMTPQKTLNPTNTQSTPVPTFAPTMAWPSTHRPTPAFTVEDKFAPAPETTAPASIARSSSSTKSNGGLSSLASSTLEVIFGSSVVIFLIGIASHCYRRLAAQAPTKMASCASHNSAALQKDETSATSACPTAKCPSPPSSPTPGSPLLREGAELVTFDHVGDGNPHY